MNKTSKVIHLPQRPTYPFIGISKVRSILQNHSIGPMFPTTYRKMSAACSGFPTLQDNPNSLSFAYGYDDQSTRPEEIIPHGI